MYKFMMALALLNLLDINSFDFVSNAIRHGGPPAFDNHIPSADEMLHYYICMIFYGELMDFESVYSTGGSI